MRLFEVSGCHYSFLRNFYRGNPGLIGAGFGTIRDALIDAGFGNLHYLKPVIDRSPEAFFTYGDDPVLQGAWARRHGLRSRGLSEILLAQIEEHRTEVFYSLDPDRFDGAFLSRLPGCVRHTICWRAAPGGVEKCGAYQLRVCNFAGIIRGWRSRGLRGEWFFPCCDEATGESADPERDVDITFAGSYSRHHTRRNRLLQALAELCSDAVLHFYLEKSRVTRIASLPGVRHLTAGSLAVPRSVQAVASGPVFGRALYAALRRSKIVLNASIDMANEDKGNMRCFEALGCGAVMLSDRGVYPEGMEPGVTFLDFADGREMLRHVREILSDWERWKGIGENGRRTVRELYSRTRQWVRFEELVGGLG